MADLGLDALTRFRAAGANVHMCLAVVSGEGGRHLRASSVVNADEENLRRAFGLHAVSLGIGVEALTGEAFSQGWQEGGDPSGLGQQGIGVMEGGDDLPFGEAVGVVVDECLGQSLDQGRCGRLGRRRGRLSRVVWFGRRVGHWKLLSRTASTVASLGTMAAEASAGPRSG